MAKKTTNSKIMCSCARRQNHRYSLYYCSQIYPHWEYDLRLSQCMLSVIFWVKILCSPVGGYHNFWETCCLHLLRWTQSKSSYEITSYYFLKWVNNTWVNNTHYLLLTALLYWSAGDMLPGTSSVCFSTTSDWFRISYLESNCSSQFQYFNIQNHHYTSTNRHPTNIKQA